MCLHVHVKMYFCGICVCIYKSLFAIDITHFCILTFLVTNTFLFFILLCLLLIEFMLLMNI